uniref:Bestrophin homolog n=1 Tax=Acrobeloides nanus TaxID=290746 RepID=A0A914C7C5_9BILA
MFLLGFFVTVVFNRWVNIFSHVGFIDNLALSIAANIPGKDMETKLVRRNIIRYAVLSQTLVYRDISLQVRKRFPDMESMFDAGLISENEWEIYIAKEMQDNKYWMPIQWAMLLIQKARSENKICNDVVAFNLTGKLIEFRNDLQYLCCSDWVPVPLSYPQIVFLAVRCYLLISVIARQSLASDEMGRFFPLLVLSMELLLTTGFEIVELHPQPACDGVDTFWGMASAKPLDSYAPTETSKRRVTPYHGSVANVEIEQDAYECSRRRLSIRTIRSRAMSILSVCRDSKVDRTPMHSSLDNRSSIKQINDFSRRRSRLESVYEEETKTDDNSSKETNISENSEAMEAGYHKHLPSRRRSKST